MTVSKIEVGKRYRYNMAKPERIPVFVGETIVVYTVDKAERSMEIDQAKSYWTEIPDFFEVDTDYAYIGVVNSKINIFHVDTVRLVALGEYPGINGLAVYDAFSKNDFDRMYRL